MERNTEMGESMWTTELRRAASSEKRTRRAWVAVIGHNPRSGKRVYETTVTHYLDDPGASDGVKWRWDDPNDIGYHSTGWLGYNLFETREEAEQRVLAWLRADAARATKALRDFEATLAR